MSSTHDGGSNFIIHGYLRSGEYHKLIVNEIGSYSGREAINIGTESLDLQADGNGTLATPEPWERCVHGCRW